MLTIYTDGACDPNPGPGAWAWLCVENGEQRIGREANTTNNRMEMQAIIEALRYVPEGEAAVIRSDSQLCINQLTKGWKAKANTHLVNMARKVAALRPLVRFEWVRGHNGDRWNEQVDAIANAAIRGGIPDVLMSQAIELDDARDDRAWGLC